MSWVIIGLAATTMLAMALVLSFVLGWANRAFHVEVDPRIDAAIEVLPGANCGGCGYVGCGEYAESIVLENAPVNKCTVGGDSVMKALADVMGVDAEASFPWRPVVHCGAHLEDRLGRNPYIGEQRCATANLVTDVQGCTYGCLGFGDCTRACSFDAIHVEDGLARVDYEKCVGCGACAKACPRNIITMAPFKSERMLVVECSNLDAGKDVKAVCKVGCLGCKACERISDMFALKNNLSTIDYECYDPENMEDCLKAADKCPRNRLVFVGKPTEKDLKAVADEELPDVLVPDFKTTVDDTEWRG
ncbi:ferredoxin [Desulfosarcina ovata subsp. sediminis]|uniref:Ion-translocating oxidoreductase complex subunit B n=1 Tax=Desulfosarcina ovata subsp. sediminis TaxID=885957 RepID=A0A5K7ZYM0_9BACT|nr:RnfABCDGE type electron transport complex subunit B [Desulfosarcina ovata]BBO85362.1 ferredoxin [Desulfosarcina ovata subsp. sediminis]